MEIPTGGKGQTTEERCWTANKVFCRIFILLLCRVSSPPILSPLIWTLMHEGREREVWFSTRRFNFDFIFWLVTCFDLPPQVEVKEVEQVTFPAQETIDQVSHIF